METSSKDSQIVLKRGLRDNLTGKRKRISGTLQINFPVRLCVIFHTEMKFAEGFFFLSLPSNGGNKVWQTFFFSTARNVKEKSPQTEVESVTVHRGWCSTMLLSGGKLLHQLNFMCRNWFSATAAAERSCSCIKYKRGGKKSFVFWMWLLLTADVTRKLCKTI